MRMHMKRGSIFIRCHFFKAMYTMKNCRRIAHGNTPSVTEKNGFLMCIKASCQSILSSFSIDFDINKTLKYTSFDSFSDLFSFFPFPSIFHPKFSCFCVVFSSGRLCSFYLLSYNLVFIFCFRPNLFSFVN